LLKRKALSAFIDWKTNKTKQALLVTGARQVGKTFLIREFARQHYQSFVEINLVENADAREAFIQARSSEDYLLALSLFAGDRLIENETLVFIDEIQESPEIVTAIKFLVDRGGFDYVLSGSLLGVELKNIRSVPVGYLRTIEMFPLDFDEYCWARGVGDPVIDEAQVAFDIQQAVPGFIHNRLLKLFHEYLVVGGMPDPVNTFVQDLNIERVRALQGGIIETYKQDATKYNFDRSRVIKRIYELIPSELGQQNRKFTIKSIDGIPRHDRYADDFLWLVDAGIAIASYNVREPRHPLMLSAGSTQFKLFNNDVGLLASMCGMDETRETLFGSSNANYGSFYENAAAQELKAHGFEPYYFKNKRVGELDFVIETKQGEVIPLEIKSGKNYQRHNALTNVLSTPSYGIERAYVFYDGNTSVKGSVTYCPIYMMGRLQR